MSRDLYILSRDSDLHLRDARHAYQLFTQHSFALSPKVKFLYHINFLLTEEARDSSPNSERFNLTMGVLAKSVDLPSYRASVDTKNQYNRKKHIQTRIDYNEIAMRFYDDNTGLTRALFEEYYKYYFMDGRKLNSSDINPRDKYSNSLKRYGLDTRSKTPFFDFIKIYQLSRQEWFSYTLVNPLITSWNHDSLDYSDGAGIMENNLSVAYEAVLYNRGKIRERGEPVGFTHEDTRYDQVPSPLTVNSPDGIPGGNTLPPAPKVIDLKFQNEAILPVVDRSMNRFSLRGSGGQDFVEVLNLPSAIPQTRVPKTNTQSSATLSTTLDRSIQNLDSDNIIRELNRNPSALTSLTKKILATGSYSAEWDSRNFDQFKNLPAAEQNSIKTNILSRIPTDKKFQQIASQIISATRSQQ
jgi:hypothetical protein